MNADQVQPRRKPSERKNWLMLGALVVTLFVGGMCVSRPVKRVGWTYTMRSKLPELFCKNGSYFRTCFALDAARCEEISQKWFDECAKRPGALPAIVSSETGRESGRILGECIGGEVERELRAAGKALTHPDPKCFDASAWLPSGK